MASVAGASATAWVASVVTASDTRYLSGPEVARLLLDRLAVTANASGTLGSGTCVHPGGIGNAMSSARKPCGRCASRLTFLPWKYSRSVPELAGRSAGATGGEATAGAGGVA